MITFDWFHPGLGDWRESGSSYYYEEESGGIVSSVVKSDFGYWEAADRDGVPRPFISKEKAMCFVEAKYKDIVIPLVPWNDADSNPVKDITGTLPMAKKLERLKKALGKLLYKAKDGEWYVSQSEADIDAVVAAYEEVFE